MRHRYHIVTKPANSDTSVMTMPKELAQMPATAKELRHAVLRSGLATINVRRTAEVCVLAVAGELDLWTTPAIRHRDSSLSTSAQAR